MPAIAQVEPLTNSRALHGPFDYRLPDDLAEQIAIGSTLLIPLGRREVLGVVVGLTDRSEISEQRLLAPLHAPAFGVPGELVALAQWIAAEYCSTLSRALSLMLTPGAARGARPLRRLTASITEAGSQLLSQDAAEIKTQRLSDRQLQLLRALVDGPMPAAEMPGGSAALRRLADRGLVTVRSCEVPRRPHRPSVGVRLAEPPALTDEQRLVVDDLRSLLDSREHSQQLLCGVTGSGKTEVYLRLTAVALEQGRGVIVLVPEIALTPQTVSRFVERFGDTVAVLHSRLSLGERHDEWWRLRRGEARVCVGPRSAIFAPVCDVGLVIIDEEHDPSYKHEGDPRYDAREVALMRAQRARALLLMGSATPRAESFHANVPLRLRRRVDDRPLPTVEILDMRGATCGLHPQSIAALAQVRRQRSKAIVLLNRRGWSNFLSCRSCGLVWGCPRCDVALVLHRAHGFVACHHCGYRERVPEHCRCGSAALARHGEGTERVEHDLRLALGDDGFQVFRLDADSVANAGDGGLTGLLQRFEAAPAGVLIGTQMVAKGHDFAGVSVGVVLDADATLRFPDFRAEERTFALIAQLAGRVGRGGEGRVLVQTIAPQARAIRYAAEHDSDGFLQGELERRSGLGYPPFSHLIRIVASALDASATLAAADELASRLRAAGVDLLGPAPLFRLRGRERHVLVLKAAHRAPAAEQVDRALRELTSKRTHQGVNFSVDVDPQ